MQIKRLGEIEAFLRKPAGALEGALIHGRDQGLIRERSKALQTAVLGAKPDPFALVELGESVLKDAPGALYAEAAAIAMLGGKKFIRLRTSSDIAVAALKAYLAEREAGGPRPDAFFVIEAGELRSTNALRKAAESSTLLAAIACYPDDQASLEALIDEMLRAAGASIEPGARAALLERLGSDRGISRQEIEKLLLYCGAAPGKPVTVRREDVLELVGDTGASELDLLIDAVFTGDSKATARLSGRLSGAGTQPMRVLRAVAMHLDRLAATEAGRGPSFGYFQAEAVRRHAARWSPSLVARAQGLLLEAEIQCKTTGFPAAEICERTLLALARGARDSPVG